MPMSLACLQRNNRHTADYMRTMANILRDYEDSRDEGECTETEEDQEAITRLLLNGLRLKRNVLPYLPSRLFYLSPTTP